MGSSWEAEFLTGGSSSSLNVSGYVAPLKNHDIKTKQKQKQNKTKQNKTKQNQQANSFKSAKGGQLLHK